jgi:glycosyltransferase involved in cell wall biosynthesis
VFTSDHRNPIPYQLSEYMYEGIHVTKLSVPEVARRDLHYQDDTVYEIFSRYLECNPPDLIHFHCIQMLTASMLAAALNRNIPYLVTVHDAWWISEHQFLVDNQGEVCNLQQNDPIVAAQTTEDVATCIKRQRYLAKYLNKAQRILAVSQRFAEIYRQNGFPQTETNRNGIIPKPVLPRKPSSTGRVRLGHGGGISAHKGYYLLKEVVEKANLAQTEVIAVDLSQTDEVILREEQWGSTPVKIIARVEPSKMPEFFSTIDVLVAPSIWPESFGLITREAVAAGVWVVASDQGALAEDIIAGVNGDIFSTDNIDELVDILTQIDQQSEKYQQLVTADINIRTTEEQVRELCKIYEDIFRQDK